MKVLSTRAAQRWLATSIALFVGSTHALQLEDISNKSAAIYTDIQVTAQHQYYIGTVFDSLNKYLCSLAQNRHEKYANFMSGFAGSAQAYRANLDEATCGMVERDAPQIVLATQDSPDSDMLIKQWVVGGADGIYPYAMRATISEEASEDNPFGILDLGIQVLSAKTEPETVYKFRMKSAYEDEDTVSVKAAMYLDQVIVDNTKELNFEAQFFAADLDHNVENSGQGTIVAKYFSPRADDRLYPEGRPLAFRAINLAYDREVLRYSVQADIYLSDVAPYFPNQDGYATYQANEGDYCIKRSDPWTYVDKYGVYDAQGDQNAESFSATFTDDNGDTHTLSVNGMDYATASGVCRAWSDGSVTGEEASAGACSGVSNTISSGVVLRSIDLPDYAEIVRADAGQERYLVRRLLIRRVFPQVDSSNCETLRLPVTRATPNHLFFGKDALLDFSWPSSGAVVINAFEEAPEKDGSGLAGVWYRPWEDADKDGVLNYSDAFPDDATKTADSDYDGIDDSVDDSDDLIDYDHADIYLPDAVEFVSPSAAQP